MSKITKDQAKDLRNAFQCWQQYYDPAEDKEQYDMFGLGMVAMDALLASLEAEPVSVFKIDHESSLIKHVKKVVSETKAPPAQVLPDLKELEAILDWILMLPCPTPKATHFAKRLAVVIDTCRAAMLQGAEPVTTANKLPEGWVMVPKEPTEVMFNAGKLAAGPTKQPYTASLVYKAMIDSSPDYKVGRETAYTGYEVQENVKDYVRRKIHTAFDVEKAVLWILKNSKYPEPDLWVFDIKVQFVDGPVILTDKSVTVVHSTLCKCSSPVGNVQFIECTLPAEWEGKVNAIDCVFKAEPQQEVK